MRFLTVDALLFLTYTTSCVCFWLINPKTERKTDALTGQDLLLYGLQDPCYFTIKAWHRVSHCSLNIHRKSSTSQSESRPVLKALECFPALTQNSAHKVLDEDLTSAIGRIGALQTLPGSWELGLRTTRTSLFSELPLSIMLTSSLLPYCCFWSEHHFSLARLSATPSLSFFFHTHVHTHAHPAGSVWHLYWSQSGDGWLRDEKRVR